MVAPASRDQLQAFLADHPLWAFDPAVGLTRQLVFADFAAAMAFLQRGAQLAEALDHHPDWRNVYNRVWVSLTTHDAGGVSQRDFTLAEQFDRLAEQLKAAPPPSR